MPRSSLVRAVVALAVLLASTYVVLTSSPRLGLDLRGGTQIVLETSDSPTVTADAEATDRTLEVLRRRVDALGVSEPTLARSGERRIIVELPGLQDPAEAAEVIGRTAQLTFHPVLGPGTADQLPDPDAAEPDTSAELTLPDDAGLPLRLGPAALSGDGVTDASALIDQERGGGWFVSIDFAGPGQRAWQAVTGEAACAPPGDPTRRVAIVLDGEVISSPQVNVDIVCGVGIPGSTTQITGQFTQEEAQDLAVLIAGGALPVPVEIIEQRTVGPTLGAAAIDASAKAALIGIALTAIFIIAVYRLMGVLAAIALGCYALISYAALTALGATLTLPGLAGFVLAIGMAVDANVLVFERAREEYEQQPDLRRAVTNGFRNALSAIADSNVTTLLAAGLLFFLASGPVRGFGVTLSIGVLASMLSALVLTRVLAEAAAASAWVRNRPRITGLASLGRVRTALAERDPDLMGHSRRWLAVSAAAVLVSIAGIAVRGLEFGVEFTGGRLVEYSTSSPVDADEARAAVSAAGFPRAVVQASGDGDVTVRTQQLTDAQQAEIRAAIGEVAGGAEVLRDELIGPSLGSELRRNALIALGIALAAQLAYLAVRFRWTFGAGAVAALFHNAIVVTGIFAWLGKPIDGVFLAALLTIIGYTVNDSVVVFDRIRETWRENRDTPFPRVANTAILQTLPRTVNTGLSTLIILVALLVLGGDSLADFALALLLGIVIGTASSIFTATPTAVELEARTGAPPPMPPAPRGEGWSGRPRGSDEHGAVV
ncbi:MAG TPA: protein translocase subunit SecD [Jiangellales bacterium]|nr:protein translocase subunit SecD [Jiangellales bacterium]